jgi:hypothetical protein
MQRRRLRSLTKHAICNCLLLLLVSRIKLAEVPAGAHAEETSKDIEAAELDDV